MMKLIIIMKDLWVPLLAFLGGIVMTAGTLLTANRTARRDDFLAIVNTLTADNEKLRNRMKEIDAELEDLHEERLTFMKTISELRQEIDKLRAELKRHENET